jgi:hypothetical protein
LEFSDQAVDKYQHNVLDEKQIYTNLNSKNEMHFLHQVHELDMAEEGKGIYLKCCKILESCEERGEDDNTFHSCDVVWYDINKVRSWVDAFSLCVDCPVLNASMEILLHNISFCHITHYCMTRTEVEKAKVICFDVKNVLGHKVRLVAGNNLAMIEREIFY